MTPLEDSDSMPFGKHRGKMMIEVTAAYLQSLWNERTPKDIEQCPVIDYIERNMVVLQTELPNAIWT